MEDFVKKNMSLQNKIQRPAIFELARVELDKIIQKRIDDNQSFKSTSDVIVTFGRLTKDHTFRGLEDPRPLRAYVKILDEIAHGNRTHRWIIGCPPQHGKTLTSLCGLIYFAVCNPGSRSLYISYSADRSDQMQKLYVAILKSLGFNVISGNQFVKFGKNSIVYFKGPLQVTGFTCTGICLVDDIYSGYHECSYENTRKTIKNIVFGDIMSRSQGGCAFLFVGTRFNKNDVQSDLLNSKFGFKNLQIPALCIDPHNDPAGRTEYGQVLWEERKSLEYCLQIREADPIVFQCMYQNDPGSLGQNYFKEPRYYQDRSDSNKIIKKVAGIDLGYSSTGDYCTYIEITKTNVDLRVTKVYRKLTTFEQFADDLLDFAKDIPIRLYGTAQEVALCKMLSQRGLKINAIITNKSKVERSRPVYCQWNVGKLLYPGEEIATQMERQSLYEILNFTGDKRKHDDTVDAIAAAFDELNSSHGGAPKVNHSALINIDRQLAHNERL